MNLVNLNEWTGEAINELIDQAIEIKKNKGKYASVLNGKTLAMLFQKTSTRTRMSFEAGMTQLGGHAIFLDWRTTNFTLGDIKDEVKCMDRYADIIMARVYKHEQIQAIADASKVPVINGLCDKYHPCQALGDLMTIKEKKGKLDGVKIAFIGDGNNVCNSLINGCTKTGMKLTVANPKGYEPLIKAEKMTNDPKEAANDVDFVYTDTWISMGMEEEKEKRMKDFEGFQVDEQLLGDAMLMHCLPAHRGIEVSDTVLDSKSSIVYDQAENRMHIQKAIILKLLGLI